MLDHAHTGVVQPMDEMMRGVCGDREDLPWPRGICCNRISALATTHSKISEPSTHIDVMQW